MITPARVDLVAQRWTPFVDVTAIEGFDLTDATFALQVRLYRDAPGDPLISLTNAISSAQGVSVSVATVDGQPVSSVQIRINETTLEGLLPFQVTDGRPNRKPGSDLDSLVYDLHITTTGLGKVRWTEGAFTIRAGSTQNG